MIEPFQREDLGYFTDRLKVTAAARAVADDNGVTFGDYYLDKYYFRQNPCGGCVDHEQFMYAIGDILTDLADACLDGTDTARDAEQLEKLLALNVQTAKEPEDFVKEIVGAMQTRAAEVHKHRAKLQCLHISHNSFSR